MPTGHTYMGGMAGNARQSRSRRGRRAKNGSTRPRTEKLPLAPIEKRTRVMQGRTRRVRSA